MDKTQKLRTVTKWYHATTVDNARSIIQDGCIKSFGKAVFLASKKEHAMEFVAMKGETECVVFTVRRNDLDKNELTHNVCAKPMLYAQYPDLFTAVYFGDVKFHKHQQLPCKSHCLPGMEYTHNGRQSGVTIKDMDAFMKYMRQETPKHMPDIDVDAYNDNELLELIHNRLHPQTEEA